MDRIQAIRKIMDKQGLDCLLVMVAENRRWLSGFTGTDTQCDESAGVLFLTQDKLLLATDSRYTVQAQNDCPDWEVFTYKVGLAKSLPRILDILSQGKPIRRVGFEDVKLTVRQHRLLLAELEKAGLDVELLAIKDLVEDLRQIKTPEEVRAMEKSLHLAEQAFLEVLKTLKPGMTEKQAAWDLEKMMREMGAEGLAFETIVAGGPNSALPHAVPTDRPIREGEPLLFDWGAVLNGYCSDISRTLVLGKPDETFNKVFATVAQAQQRAFEAIAPGADSKEVDARARDHIAEQGFEGRFGHGLGHGVGLAVHEAPRLGPVASTPLTPGMVFTVEPGIYLPDWGGVRLENMVVVTDDGVRWLNNISPDYNLFM